MAWYKCSKCGKEYFLKVYAQDCCGGEAEVVTNDDNGKDDNKKGEK